MFSRLRSFLTAWTWRARFEDALDEEVRFHLDVHAEDLVRSGVPIQEAKRRARVRFGSVEGMKHHCRQARGLRFADESRQDLRYAIRSLRRQPGFGLTATLTLGVGLGLWRSGSSPSSMPSSCGRCRLRIRMISSSCGRRTTPAAIRTSRCRCRTSRTGARRPGRSWTWPRWDRRPGERWRSRRIRRSG